MLGQGGSETSFASFAEAVSAATPYCEILIDGVVEVSVGERGEKGVCGDSCT